MWTADILCLVQVVPSLATRDISMEMEGSTLCIARALLDAGRFYFQPFILKSLGQHRMLQRQVLPSSYLADTRASRTVVDWNALH